MSSVLGGCKGPGAQAPPIILYNTLTNKKMTNVPASLGILVPRVPGYQCGGTYVPAAKAWPTPGAAVLTPPIGLPFWQVTMTCLNPQIKTNLPEGTTRAGMVWVFEQPGPSFAEIPKDMSIDGAKNATLGALSVVEGKMDLGGYTTNALAYLGDKTAYIGYGGKQRTGLVLVDLTGRAVPMSVLLQFAKSMYPVSRTQ